MVWYQVTTNYAYGVSCGTSGFYLYVSLWFRYRHHKCKEYGPGELRLYYPRWWKSHYDKKGKISWRGTIFDWK